MPKKIMDFDVVSEIALVLPDVKESTIHGAPSLKARGEAFNVPSSSLLGRAELADGSNRF